MEFMLNNISVRVLPIETYAVELACSFGDLPDGSVNPNFARISINFSKNRVEGLTLAEIEAAAIAEARTLLA